MVRETAHERVCTFLVSSDKAQASANEIREALESSDDDAKVEALETAIACLLAGEQLPSLFITIVRYVLPSENHQVQKLLLLYLETIEKTDASGKLLPEMILICQNLRNNLQHPNEYIRGVTLRFISRIKEEELLEPLIPSVMSNLEHRHSYVRKNAVLALDAIYRLPRGELLAPDAPEVIERLLGNEQDLSTRRNAFRMLARHARDRAVSFLLSNVDRLAEWGDVLQMAALELARKVCGADPSQKPRFMRVILALLQSRHSAVVYEAAVALMRLSSAPSAVRGAASTFVQLLASQSDNNVKLIVLDRLEELKEEHPEATRESLMGVLRVLSTPDLDVRRKALAIALDLVNERSVDDVVGVLKKEIMKTAADADRSAEYGAILVDALHACASRFPRVAGSVLNVLVDFLSDTNASAALDVAYFVREIMATNAALHATIVDRLIESFSSIGSPRVSGAVLWILAEYCEEREEMHRVIQLVRESVGVLPATGGGEYDGGIDLDNDHDKDDGSSSLVKPVLGNTVAAAASVRPIVLPDGSYATQTALPGAGLPTASTPRAGSGGILLTSPERTGLRAALLAGDGFLASIVAASLTKMVLRLHATRALSAPALHALTAELMLLVVGLLQLRKPASDDETDGDLPRSVWALDEDARDRLADCIRAMADERGADEASNIWLDATRAAYDALLAEREAAAEAEAKREAARNELEPDDAIECPYLSRAGASAGGAARHPASSASETPDEMEADILRATQGDGGSSSTTTTTTKSSSKPAALASGARLSRVVQLTGFSDPLYAEAYVTVHQYDVVLDVAVTNRTEDTLQSVTLELSTMGDLKLVERPTSHTLAAGGSCRIRANIKVSSTETGAIFGNLVFEGTGYGERNVVVLNDIHIDILDYIVPASCSDAAFRAMWAEFEWENKVAVSTSLADEAAYLDHVIAATNMRCLTPASARAGDAGFLAANLYARSVFDEDALVNVAVERGDDGKLSGFVRIRSKTQGIALSLGDKLILKQKGT